MLKRSFDFVLSLVGLLLIGWVIFLFWLIASYDTKSNGLFVQDRVGQYARIFRILKLKTMRDNPQGKTISRIGAFFRKSKIDELPQLWNVLVGDMSLVGPRPDIPGYYDKLQGENRKILDLKPGLTGPASLFYFDEEQMLAGKENPQKYNDEIIFPDKIRINLKYQKEQSFWLDCKILFYTFFGSPTWRDR